jgi:hypothetical protein
MKYDPTIHAYRVLLSYCSDDAIEYERVLNAEHFQAIRLFYGHHADCRGLEWFDLFGLRVYPEVIQ